MSGNIQLPPPTPTLTPRLEEIDLPALSEVLFDGWDVAPEVVGLWNVFDDYTPVLQVIFLLMLVMGIIFIIIKQSKDIAASTTSASSETEKE